MIENSRHCCGDIEDRRRSHLLLDFALFRGKDERFVIFFGEVGRNLYFQVNAIHKTGKAVGVHPLDDSNVVSRQVALPAETKHIYTSTGTERG